jgi:hypothetical protein
VDGDDGAGDLNIDQDYQFRIRAIAQFGTATTPVYNYSDWVQYPMADDAVTVGGKEVL